MAYLEWWFDPQSDFFKYDPENDFLKLGAQQATKLWRRNQALALELVSANAIVAPTMWQARQLPSLLRERCHIIHDGVDLEKFKPSVQGNQNGPAVVTYGTRGMEAMRAFPQLIIGLLPLLKGNRDLIVEIAGEDRINYGGSAPDGFDSWGAWAKRKLLDAGVEGRIKWLGYLGLNDYVSWLQSSHCHVHLSHPFVASWSLLEALACECPMVVSDVEPVRELCQGTSSKVTYVDHRNPQAITKSIQKTLGNHKRRESSHMRPMMSRYSSAYSLEQWSLVADLQLTTKD